MHRQQCTGSSSQKRGTLSFETQFQTESSQTPFELKNKSPPVETKKLLFQNFGGTIVIADLHYPLLAEK
jgi:hypothetical protein